MLRLVMRGLFRSFPLLSLLVPALASAQAPSPGAPPQGKIDLTTTPPAPFVQRSYHFHEGFYARVSVGFGSLGASFDDDHASRRDLEGSGLSLGGDVMIGGSPSPGLAIGGALLGQGASPEFERGSAFSEDRGLSVFILGPFIDGFPNPVKGWHFGGMLGLAAVTIEDSAQDGIQRTTGAGAAAWVGHDFWVADEWSMGPLLRLTGTVTEGDDARASSLSAMLLFTALCH